MGTLGMTAGLGSVPPLLAAIGGSGVSLQAADVVGTGLSGIGAHAACPPGSMGMPGAASPADIVVSHAAAGPESRHWCRPAGRLSSESSDGAVVAQPDSGSQADRAAWSAGTDSTAGAAATETTLS